MVDDFEPGEEALVDLLPSETQSPLRETFRQYLDSRLEAYRKMPDLAAAKIAKQRGIEDGYRTVLNVGPGSGQSVFHMHVHLLGGRKLAWPPG